MQGQDFLPYIITVSIMIVLVTIAGIVLYFVRGRLFGGGGSRRAQTGGMLETMRQMRDRGEISEEEYRTAQAALVAKASEAKEDRQTHRSSPGADHSLTRSQTARSDERRAQPGFDLTGDPLPPSSSGSDSGPEELD